MNNTATDTANLATRFVGLVCWLCYPLFTMAALLRRRSARGADCHMDTQHLQGLSQVFTTKLDLVLTARDGSQEIGFPVHQIIVAHHSPTLGSMLEGQLSSKYFTALSETLPYIPMIGDRCTAIRLALAFMYNPPPEPSHTTTRQIAAESDPPALTLDRVPAAARELEFAHKYGMLELQIAQEAFLVEPLQHEFDYCNGDRPTVDQVIDCAVAAANFNLGALLTMCESVILGDHIQTDLYKKQWAGCHLLAC